jgi:ribosome maturation factor RimP
LLTEVLAEKPLFLIDLAITDAFKVITLDDDNGVVLQDCIDISRAIEEFRQEEQDYSLEVACRGSTIKEDQTIQEKHR